MAPFNKETGHPYPPSRQLLARWMVDAWKKVPESLIARAWEVGEYHSTENLNNEAASNAIINYSEEDCGSMVKKLAREML